MSATLALRPWALLYTLIGLIWLIARAWGPGIDRKVRTWKIRQSSSRKSRGSGSRRQRSGMCSHLRALNDAESLAESVPENATLEVVDFVVTPGVRRSRIQGQPDTECLNVYILTRDGRAFMTQSDGIARSVQQIMALYPESPRNLEGNGNTLKTLVPID